MRSSLRFLFRHQRSIDRSSTGSSQVAASAEATSGVSFEDLDQTVYGVVTVLSLHDHRQLDCIAQLKNWILTSCPDPAVRVRPVLLPRTFPKHSNLCLNLIEITYSFKLCEVHAPFA